MLARETRSVTNNPYASAHAMARQVVGAQCVLAMAAAVLCLPAGWTSALAALAGALVVAIGTAIFAWRQFAGRLVSVPQMARRFYGAGVLKWAWTLFSLLVLFAYAKAPPLPLLSGLILAQFGGWFVLLRK